MSEEDELERRIEEIVDRRVEEKLEKLESRSEDEKGEEKVSRREFLKSLGFGAAGLGALAMLPTAAANVKITDTGITRNGVSNFWTDGSNTLTGNLDMNDNQIVGVNNIESTSTVTHLTIFQNGQPVTVRGGTQASPGSQLFRVNNGGPVDVLNSNLDLNNNAINNVDWANSEMPANEGSHIVDIVSWSGNGFSTTLPDSGTQKFRVGVRETSGNACFDDDAAGGWSFSVDGYGTLASGDIDAGQTVHSGWFTIDYTSSTNFSVSIGQPSGCSHSDSARLQVLQ